MSLVYRCFIVPESKAQSSRDLSAKVAGPTGDGMYVSALSPNGQLPATHWISAGLVRTEYAGLMPLTTYIYSQEPGGAVTAATTPGSAASVAYLAGQPGALPAMAVTAEDVQAIFDAADITEEDPFVAMARLGLMRVRGVE